MYRNYRASVINGPWLVLVFDMQQAFDRNNNYYLLALLWDFNFPTNLIQLINWLQKRTLRVNVNNTYLKTIRTQGNPTSFFLFSLGMTLLIVCTHKAKTCGIIV